MLERVVVLRPDFGLYSIRFANVDQIEHHVTFQNSRYKTTDPATVTVGTYCTVLSSEEKIPL